MTTTVALNRQRSSPLWWMLKKGSLLAGAGIIGIAFFIVFTYAGHFAWVNWVSPRMEKFGIATVEFAKEATLVMADQDLTEMASAPATDQRPPLFDPCENKAPAGQEEIRLRECEKELKSSVEKRS